MKNQGTILIIGILLVGFFLFGNLGLFSIYPSNAILTSDDSWISTDPDSKHYTAEYGDATFLYVWGNANRRAYMKFPIPLDVRNAVKSGVELDTANLNLYINHVTDGLDMAIYGTSNNWQEETINGENAPSTTRKITTESVGDANEDEWIIVTGFEDYIENQIKAGETEISLVFANPSGNFGQIWLGSKEKSGDYSSYFIIDYTPPECIYGEEKCDGLIWFVCSDFGKYEEQGTSIEHCGIGECVENTIIQIDSDYYICKSDEYRKILDVLELSEEEQARLMNIINQLELTIEQKAQIIADLTSTLEGQLVMIEQLELLTEEKAQIIAQLKLNIEEQATLITEMQLTVAEQVVIIEALDLTIQQQADLINQMKVNLAAKAALIQLLQIENENQAALIAEMELSFAEQVAIINALENLIGDDAEIIINLYGTIAEQAQLINELEFTKDELAKLVSAMGLTIQENADLINQLELTTEEQLAIIAELELSLEQERELVTQLRLTIEEQNRLIEELKKKPIVDFDLEEIWEQYKLWILIGGAVLLLLILTGRKR